MMDAVIFIKTSESGTSREILRTVKRLGYDVILFTDMKKQALEETRYSEVDLLIYSYNLSYEYLSKYIKEGLITYNIKGIFSFIDGFVSIASKLSEKFSDNILNSTAIEIMEDKYKTRSCFKNNFFTPLFLSSTEIKKVENLRLPIAYKEPMSTGAKGVKKIKTIKQLEQYKNSNDSLKNI